MAPAAALYSFLFLPIIWPNPYINYYEAKEVIGPPATKRLKNSTEPKIEEKDLMNGLYYMEIDQENAALVENEMVKQNFSKDEVKGLIYFVSDTLETNRMGTLGGMSSWCLIGLPKYWNLWDTADDVELDKVRHCWPFFNKTIQKLVNTTTSLDVDKVNEHLNQDEIKELKETFILSEKAKKYAIASVLLEARDVATVVSQQHAFPWLVTLMKTIPINLNDSLDMFNRPMLIRFSLYVVTSSTLILGTVSMLKIIESMLVKYQAEQMKSFGTEYVEGAVEYFEKQIRRAELMRKTQNNIYDEKGDVWRIVERSPDSRAIEQLTTYKEMLL